MIKLSIPRLFCGKVTSKPFFRLFSDEIGAIDGFMDAVNEGNIETAQSYLSKSTRTGCLLNYNELKNMFDKSGAYTKMNAVRFSRLPDSIKPSSLFFGATKSILHVYTVLEPDSISSWKICGIERE